MADLKRDIETMVRSLQRDYGCTVRSNRGGHYVVSRPGYGVITVSHSPSDPRAIKNARADARRCLGVSL